MKLVLWGAGKTAKEFLLKKAYYKDDSIVAIIDNNRCLWKKEINKIQIMAPIALKELEFDKIIICAQSIEEIKKQLMEELNICEEKIISLKQMEECYIAKIEKKYCGTNDIEIDAMLASFKMHGISVFGNYMPDTQLYEVKRDVEGYPYVLFENKKIYYPSTFNFINIDNKEYIGDVMYEQKDGSPHLYIKDESVIVDGAVIVDAGVCEGNFAIRFIDRIKKAYLIESDPVWVECLKRTFEPYSEKVVICDKFLTKYDSSKTITLDTLLKGERVDFLKMDIEGSEIDALLGGREVLENNNMICSICSYHNRNDEDNIKFILNNLGYHTETSKGYMFFLYDENIFDTLDFRRGIVYACKDIE